MFVFVIGISNLSKIRINKVEIEKLKGTLSINVSSFVSFAFRKIFKNNQPGRNKTKVVTNTKLKLEIIELYISLVYKLFCVLTRI